MAKQPGDSQTIKGQPKRARVLHCRGQENRTVYDQEADRAELFEYTRETNRATNKEIIVPFMLKIQWDI
ncbi:MAG: hypothetical protein ACMG6H_04130, partial [Acidobacteriota bacterium]